MSGLESIEKLREWSHRYDNAWVQDDGSIVFTSGGGYFSDGKVNYGESIRSMLDEVEAEVAERYMELPLDADGVPIHENDVIQFVNEQGGTGAKVEVCAISKHYAYYGEGKHFYRANMCRHVKPRTIEDVLMELADTVREEDGYNGSMIDAAADEIRGMLLSTDYEAMREELMKLTLKELKKIAKEEGICLGYDASSKDTCVGAIVTNRRYRKQVI